MFDNRAFASWPLIFSGALLLAGLFMLAGLLIEVVFEGKPVWSDRVIGLGTLAFVGYIGIALLIRREAS